MNDYRAENTEGHAIHFLKRLKRADGDAASLALALYHDPEMIRSVLADIRIPREFERVALSLEANDDGPYIVASRTGRFVTCLGSGMSIGDLYLIPYARLAAHIAGNAALRERRAEAEATLGMSVEDLFPRLLKCGDGLSREEFLGISVLQPALKPELFRYLADLLIQTEKFACSLLVWKRFDPKTRAHFEGLKAYWNFYHATGHLTLLTSMTGHRGLERALDSLKPGSIAFFLLHLLPGSQAEALRIAWFIGKFGAAFLADCKRMVAAPDSSPAWLLGMLGLISIGLRHAKLKPQVIKAVESSFKAAEAYPERVLRFMKKIHGEIPDLFAFIMKVLLEPEKVRALSLDFTRDLFLKVYRHIDFPPTYRFEKPEDVPENLAFALGADLKESFLHTPSIALHVFCMLPWAASSAAEDFYFPQDFLKCVHKPWTPEMSIEMIEIERAARGVQKTVTVEKMPGRNDPCPCGSGRKFKKCCIHPG